MLARAIQQCSGFFIVFICLNDFFFNKIILTNKTKISIAGDNHFDMKYVEMAAHA